jgi:hypothetical protein
MVKGSTCMVPYRFLHSFVFHPLGTCIAPGQAQQSIIRNIVTTEFLQDYIYQKHGLFKVNTLNKVEYDNDKKI